MKHIMRISKGKVSEINWGEETLVIEENEDHQQRDAKKN